MLWLLIAQGADLQACQGNQLPPQYRLCLEQQLQLEKSVLNIEYNNTIRAIRSHDTSDLQTRANALSTLNKSQKAWLAFREQECQLRTSIAYSGSHWDLYYKNCLVELTKARTASLRKIAADFSDEE